MDARQSLAADKRAPRLILDDIEESSDSIMNLTSGINDITQIYNYRYNCQTNHQDDYSVLLGMCLEQNESSFDLLDKEQGFIREINFRIGKKPSIVLFWNQTIVGLNRFCTMNAPSNYFSPLSTNTTYQIAEHYLTQTAHENLSALRRDTLKSPWFPGVCMLHREEAFENFAYLWQVAKRSNSSLSSLRVLGTDDDKTIYDAIFSECDGCTHHLLGLEHFKKNITDKLQRLNFPKRQAKIISEDIFETLYNCKDEQEFDSELEKLRDKWIEIVVRYIRNEPPGQFNSFSTLSNVRQIKQNLKQQGTHKIKLV